LVQLEVDGTSGVGQRLADGRKGGGAVGQGNQPVGPAGDRSRNDRREGKGGAHGGCGTARRTGGGQQRQEEEGQPEAAGRAVHAAMLLRNCISVKTSTRGQRRPELAL